MPPRAGDAPAGAAFLESIETLDRDAREAAIVAQVLAGNVPEFLRTLVPVVVNATIHGSDTRFSGTLCVMPDYLAVGSDADFVHVPMDLPSSLRVARALGFVLPTRKIVDAIHEQAAYKLEPAPLAPGPRMTLPEYTLTHEFLLRSQDSSRAFLSGMLVAGHKKDLVLTNLLRAHPDRVAIYGWHYPDGKVIQPLSVVHRATYADYSHGTRLVSETLTIGGRRESVYVILTDELRAALLSGEGPIAARALMGDPPQPHRESRTVRPGAAATALAASSARPRSCCNSGTPSGSCDGCPRP